MRGFSHSQKHLRLDEALPDEDDEVPGKEKRYAFSP